MSDNPPYHHIPSWGWILIVLALAMLTALLVHVVVDHGRGVGTARTSAIAPAARTHSPVVASADVAGGGVAFGGRAVG